jgi:hypothetical protein
MPKRHARNQTQLTHKLDKPSMLSRLASLKGSSLRRPAFARAMLIAGLAIAISVADVEKTYTANIEEKPFNIYNKMNVKLYLHNTIGDWYEFECALDLAYRESSFRYDAVNKTSGAYGLFQHMSEHAPKWDVFTQIDKHKEYIEARYDGSWCKALNHLKGKGWH